MTSIGIDLGGHTISAAVVFEEAGNVSLLSRITIPTPYGRILSDVTESITQMISDLSKDRDIEFVGIGVPGFLDKERRKIVKFINFAGLENIEFALLIEESLTSKGIKIPIFLENDANCAALGEGEYGVAVGMTDYAVLTLGTGIGSGVVLNGKLVTGAHGLASEFGHAALAPVVHVCGCGGIGHFETVASADWIEKAAKEVGLPSDFKVLWQRREEEKVREILNPALDALARGIATLVVTIDPEIIVLSGGMSRAEGLVEEIEKLALPYLPSPFRQYLKIVASKLRQDAALLGTGLLRNS